MIYAEFIYTGNTINEEQEFYLYFTEGKDYAIWIEHIKHTDKKLKGTEFRNIYFTRKNPAYLISRAFALAFLAKNKFTPSSRDFFYKKKISDYIT